MIEKRLVQWYAADAGVDLDIAEREVALTYVLRALRDTGLLGHLAFKGGTALRKLYMGATGRFSLDLDFTAVSQVEPDALLLDIVGVLHDQAYHGISFTIPSPNYYVTDESGGAEVTYHHDWVAAGRFGLQISFRAQPLLPVCPTRLRHERYFDWLGIEPPDIPALDLHEMIGEKIRAAAQRSRVRDLYDLYQLASQPFDRGLVRRIAIVKCWETRYALDPDTLLSRLAMGNYDWGDLRRLVRRNMVIAPEEIVRGVQRAYAFLGEMTEEEARLAADPYGRERRIYRQVVDSLAL